MREKVGLEIQKERRVSFELLVVPFERPCWPQEFVCASRGLLLKRPGPNYLFLAAFFLAAFLGAAFFAAFFFPPFLVAILSCSFFSNFVSEVQPQDIALACFLWARVNGAQHLAI
jgi:hypothetical protein